MTFNMKPLGCDPARIKGMSERLIVSHYENNYGGTVKRCRQVLWRLGRSNSVCVRIRGSSGTSSALNT
jgi:hypothetical protein